MAKYMILIKTKEEESMCGLADAAQDALADFGAFEKVDPDYLPIDTNRESNLTDDMLVTFIRTE